jgi:hypothetical protein
MEFEPDFERQIGLGRPKTGSALHHLVTAVSVKKALMIGSEFPAHFFKLHGLTGRFHLR